MLKYTKELFKKEKNEPIGEGLTKEQKKKYKRQFLKTWFTGILMSVVYLAGIVGFIAETFENGIHHLSLVIIISYFFIKTIREIGEEGRTIEERIQKRIIKNKKQQKKDEKETKEN